MPACHLPGVKFSMEEWSLGRILCAKFHITMVHVNNLGHICLTSIFCDEVDDMLLISLLQGCHKLVALVF